MPDRLPSLILLAGFWVPPAIAGWMVARRAQKTRTKGAGSYVAPAVFALLYSAAWFAFQLNRIPPYVPGATHDPTYAPPEAVRGLLLVATALVWPGSALAFFLAFRRAGR